MNKNYLIDTHIFLWWLENNKRLKSRVREILADPKNTIFVSVISLWEISIKEKTNKDFKLKVSLERALTASGFDILPVNLDNVLEINKLPLIHKDPFDRMLVAQAVSENMTLITDDEKIEKYKVKILK